MSEVKGFSENPVNAIKKVALDCQIDAISVYLGVVTGSHQYFVFWAVYLVLKTHIK